MRLATLLVTLATFVGLGAAVPAAANGQAVVSTERVRAELMAHAPEGVAPGKTVWVGLQIRHQPQWHTYWKNPGDSGLPTTLAWTLPAGVIAGDIAWPVPRRFPLGNLANYGYEGTVLLPVPLTITPAFQPSLLAPDLEVRLQANWLVCRKECIPEEGSFALRIPARGSTALHGGVFQAAWDARPQPLAAAAGRSGAQVQGQTMRVSIEGLPAALRGKTLEVFPETPAILEPAGAWTQAWQGAAWTAQLPLSAQRSAAPATLPVVVADPAREGAGWRTELTVTGTWPARRLAN